MLHYIEWIDEIGEGILQCPWDVAIEGNKLYVTDAKLHKVFRFSLSGNYEVSFGGYGITVGKFNTPKGIAICDSFIYISDTDNQRVVALKDKGSYIEFLRWLYPDLQENNYILDIEVDQRGVIYACDVARSKILKFSPELISHCYSFGAYGTGVNQFRRACLYKIQPS
jgi:tripartite motif-containing protein 71